MTLTITLEQMLLFLLFILGVVIGIYLLIVLKNANHLILNADKALTENRKNIDGLLSHLETLSGNGAKFSEELKEQFEKNERIVNSIFRSGADSMLAISDTADRIRIFAANFTEIMEAVKRLCKK